MDMYVKGILAGMIIVIGAEFLLICIFGLCVSSHKREDLEDEILDRADRMIPDKELLNMLKKSQKEEQYERRN